MVVTFAPVTDSCSKKKLKKVKKLSSLVTEEQIPGVLQSDELVSIIDLQGKSVGQAVHITNCLREEKCCYVTRNLPKRKKNIHIPWATL